MSGAGSFFLGLSGLGASAGISAGQSISQKKAVHEAVEEMGYVGTPDVLRMRSASVRNGGICAAIIITHVISPN